MSLFSDGLDWLDRLFRGDLWRRRHSDYFDEKKCYRFEKDSLLVYIQPGETKEVLKAFKHIQALFKEFGIKTVITTNYEEKLLADIGILFDRVNDSGGSTEHYHKEGDYSVILRAVIHISENETGKDAQKSLCHETTHLYTDGHSGDSRDANYTPCLVTGYSGADKETFRKTYRKKTK